MAKTKNNRPISEKAYNNFVKRIQASVHSSIVCRGMIRALDMYLEGETVNCRNVIDSSCRVAFQMLTYELDAAIERSAKARARAAQRREAKERAAAEAAAAEKALTESAAENTRGNTEEYVEVGEVSTKAVDINTDEDELQFAIVNRLRGHTVNSKGFMLR